jgi:hypothetical protein
MARYTLSFFIMMIGAIVWLYSQSLNGKGPDAGAFGLWLDFFIITPCFFLGVLSLIFFTFFKITRRE